MKPDINIKNIAEPNDVVDATEREELRYFLQRPLIKKGTLVKTLTFGVLLLALVIYYADFTELGHVLDNISWPWVAGALSASASSYLIIGGILSSLIKIMGYRVGFKRVFQISIVSTTINYVITAAGLGGLIIKAYILVKERIPLSRCMSISIIHGFLTNTIFVLLIYIGFFPLMRSETLPVAHLMVGFIVLALAAILTWLTLKLIISTEFRRRAVFFAAGIINRLIKLSGKKNIWQTQEVERFAKHLNEGMNTLKEKKPELTRPAMLAALDWVATLMTLYFSFLAVRQPVRLGVLIAGFSLGIFLSVISITPGSLGIMEGGMAAAFSQMNVPYESAVAAVIIFRLAYFVIPFLVSLIFYNKLLGEKRDDET